MQVSDTRLSTSRRATFLVINVLAGLPRSKRALRSRVHRLNILPYLVAGGEHGIRNSTFDRRNYNLDDISITLATRKIQLLDRKARYEKHVSGNVKTSDRGRRRVVVIVSEYFIALPNLVIPGKLRYVISAIQHDQMHQPWKHLLQSSIATPKKARKIKKVASPSRKLSPVLEEEPTKKPKRAKEPAKKSLTMPTAGVAIRDTPHESMPKKKTPAKVNRGKGIDLLSDAALLEAAEVKEALKKRKKKSHMLHPSSSGDGVGSQPKVLDESEDKTTGPNKELVLKPGVPDTQNMVMDEDDVESDANEDKEASDSEKTDSDEMRILITRIGFSTQKALQSYTTKFEKTAQTKKEKYIDIIKKSVKEIIKDEFKSQLPQILPKEISDFTTPVIQSTINESLENLDKDLFNSYGKAYSLKKGHEDKDKDKDPLAGPDQGLKKRKTSKDTEPSRGSQIEVRRADNELYTFKEGDFPRLRINDIEDMLLLVVQNRLTNPSGNDGFDFAIALLMRSDELYKFSDGTLTRLRTSLDDITKNIRMEYLPQRIWSSLENKRAHIMIKAIDNQLKERRMMRSFEKFVGGRHYGTDLRLLQRTI
ncbi:hypothetical protein Tco_0779504 [Tanacetum coccineum]